MTQLQGRKHDKLSLFQLLKQKLILRNTARKRKGRTDLQKRAKSGNTIVKKSKLDVTWRQNNQPAISEICNNKKWLV